MKPQESIISQCTNLLPHHQGLGVRISFTQLIRTRLNVVPRRKKDLIHSTIKSSPGSITIEAVKEDTYLFEVSYETMHRLVALQ